MNIENLYEILTDQPAYRIKQVERAVFFNLIESWDEATALPKDLRRKLNDEVDLQIKNQLFKSKKGDSQKALIEFSDGSKVETVLIRHNDGPHTSIDAVRGKRNTVCVSSQIGCPLDCAFCATGKMGFKRNLTKEEIVEQVLFWNRLLRTQYHGSYYGTEEKKERDCSPELEERRRVSNLVFMGMGEPFLNYENVMNAIKFLNRKEIFGIGMRNISISTIGVLEGIKKFTDEDLQINLAISLHAPNDKLRTELIPANKTWPIKKVLAAVDDYIAKTNRKVMFEYIMIKDVNDSDADARELAGLMKKKLYLVNLIPYNETEKFHSSLNKRIEKFKNILERAGVNVTRRRAFGQDIDAACGQLVTRHC
ncbi:MAG: 23S rRNA (adenine(2503)-C(2))-methyltransferase RlmN [Parcubacteria group bacterium]